MSKLEHRTIVPKVDIFNYFSTCDDRMRFTIFQSAFNSVFKNSFNFLRITVAFKNSSREWLSELIVKMCFSMSLSKGIFMESWKTMRKLSN